MDDGKKEKEKEVNKVVGRNNKEEEKKKVKKVKAIDVDEAICKCIWAFSSIK